MRSNASVLAGIIVLTISVVGCNRSDEPKPEAPAVASPTQPATIEQAKESGSPQPTMKDGVPPSSIQPELQEVSLAEAAAAWKKAGANVGWMGRNEHGWLTFNRHPTGQAGELPAFETFGIGAKELPQLPRPKQPFGLALHSARDESLEHLVHFKKLERLSLNSSSVTDQGLKQLSRFPQIRSLALSHTKITGATLKDLAGLTNLEDIELHDIKPLNGTMVRELAVLPKLQRVFFTNFGVKDEFIRGLASIRTLRELSLGGTDVTDACRVDIAKIDNLEVLRLGNAWPITGVGIGQLKRLKNLRTLTVGGQITGAGMREIASLTQIKDLSVGDCRQLTDADLSQLKSLKQLEKLDVYNNRLGGTATVKEIGLLTNLTELSVGQTALSDSDLKELAALTQLRVLELREGITDAGLKELAKFEKLEKLSLANTRINGRGLADLASLKNVQVLDLYACMGITDESLSHLVRIGRIRSLDLDRTRITDAGAKHIAALADLTELHLSDTRLTDAGLIEIGRLKQLRTLTLSRCEGVTDKGLNELKNLTELRKLLLSGTKATDDGIEVFEKSMPFLRRED